MLHAHRQTYTKARHTHQTNSPSIQRAKVDMVIFLYKFAIHGGTNVHQFLVLIGPRACQSILDFWGGGGGGGTATRETPMS